MIGYWHNPVVCRSVTLRILALMVNLVRDYVYCTLSLYRAK